MHPHSELPSLRATLKLGGKDSSDPTTWFDVKFYPYSSPDAVPVFAVTGGRNVVVCRCVLQKDNTVEILRWFKDDDPDVSFNSIEWSRAANGDPLVCVSGSNPHIIVLNVETGVVVTTLAGHGDAVNDLATCPKDPYLLASAAQDNSIRLWSLDPRHEKQPTRAICFGEGHKEQVLTIDYHRKGRYLLSGGGDTVLNMWLIPEFTDDETLPDKPTYIHYPHFSSTEIHTNFIDCVKFYNDLIISRAAKENKILLWSIDNFNSDKPPPSAAPMPPSQAVRSTTPVDVPTSSVSGTRSAWGGRFQRLLQFEQPIKGPAEFYLRFSLLHELGKHPVLAAGANESTLFFWDLQRLEEAGVDDESLPKAKDRKGGIAALRPPTDRGREGSATSTGSSIAPSVSSSSTTTTAHAMDAPRPRGIATVQRKGKAKEKGKEDKTSGIGDPFRSIVAHKKIMAPKFSFWVRQVAWSRGGDWCVATGEHGVIALFSRWENGIPPAERSIPAAVSA